MHKLDSILENQTHEILCEYDIQKDELIPARRPDVTLFF